MVGEVTDVDVDLLDNEEPLELVGGSVLERDIERDTLVVESNVEKTLVPAKGKGESRLARGLIGNVVTMANWL